MDLTSLQTQFCITIQFPSLVKAILNVNGLHVTNFFHQGREHTGEIDYT